MDAIELQTKIETAKRDVRRFYDMDRNQYLAAERRLASLLKIQKDQS